MRPAAVALSVAVVALGVVACHKPTVVTNAEVKPVAVTITCNGDGVQTSVSPYSDSLNLGDCVDWRLVSSPGVRDITIDRKPGGRWPYVESPPYRGNSERPAMARGMKSDAKGTYPYSISAVCTTASGAARRVLIDPDMIIIRGGMPPTN